MLQDERKNGKNSLKSNNDNKIDIPKAIEMIKSKVIRILIALNEAEID